MFKIKSFFKKRNKAEVNNYTSLCPLPLITKVLEKEFTIKSRIIPQRNELQYSYQLKFRANQYTDMSFSVN